MRFVRLSGYVLLKCQRSTTQTVVRFNSAFVLPGFDAPRPPGDYRVDLDEEPLEGAYET